MDRFERITKCCNLKGKGLEIGPSFNPVCPKAAGYDIEILDCLDQDGLRKRYGDDPNVGERIKQIEEVDYVWHGENYVELTGKQDYYDYIIASQVIEHTVDLIAFLNQCSMLLKKDGVLSLTVPNKYCTFDFFRENSSLSSVINRHVSGATNHSKGAIVDYYANVVKLNGIGSWDQEQLRNYGDLVFCHTKKELSNAAKTDDFVDIHEWVFTAGSFRILLNDLRELGLIDLYEDSFYSDPKNSYEFFITLKKSNSIESEESFNQEKRMALYDYKMKEDISACSVFLNEPSSIGLKRELILYTKRHLPKSFVNAAGKFLRFMRR